ncbi:MAG: hypothetical protein KDD34_04320 [Bdellovibrionales bacterium]|nr:hypothetical protein [Bdellovibrionales bacterium]
MFTFILFFLYPLNKKIRKVIHLKFYRKSHRVLKGSIWFHCASGEFEYAKPLINKIAAVSNNNCFVSYTSPSYIGPIQKFKNVESSSPLPLDLPGPVHSFLSSLEPNCLLIARTDLWPELLYQCKSKKIPIFVFAVTEKEKKGFQVLFRPWKRWLYNMTNAVLCVSEEDKKNLIELGVRVPIIVTGDPRVDLVFQRKEQPKIEKPLLPVSPELPLLCLGSTWPEDEKVIFPPLIPLLTSQKLAVILAPHEPSEAHFQSFKQRLKHTPIQLMKYSETQHLEAGTLLYIDEIGILADIYKYSSLTFVGGSFKSQVHSVMEPLAYGNEVAVGPYNKNNREAQVFKKMQSPSGYNMVTEVSNEHEWKGFVEDWLQLTPVDHENDSKSIISQLESLRGGTEKTYNYIFQK